MLETKKGVKKRNIYAGLYHIYHTYPYIIGNFFKCLNNAGSRTLLQNSVIKTLLNGCYVTFYEQKVDERCTQILILKPINIEWIKIKCTKCPFPGPKVNVYWISW